MLHVDRKDPPGRQAEVLGQPVDDRGQIEIAVRNVHRQGAAGGQMTEKDVERFLGQQMVRNRIAAEGVEHQHVERLRLGQFALQRQPRIAQHQFDRRPALRASAR